MKTKLSIILISALICSNSWAGYSLTKASWQGDLKINKKSYPCRGTKEYFSQYSSGTGVYSNELVYICLNPQNYNQASWIIKAEEGYDPEQEWKNTSYYENCKFEVGYNAANTAWVCNKKQVLSKSKMLINDKKVKLINKKDMSQDKNSELIGLRTVIKE